MSKKDDDKKSKHTDPDLSSAAKRLGEVGGKAGGPARDAALSHEEKVKIAKAGAAARWGDKAHKVKKGKGKKPKGDDKK